MITPTEILLKVKGAAIDNYRFNFRYLGTPLTLSTMEAGTFLNTHYFMANTDLEISLNYHTL